VKIAITNHHRRLVGGIETYLGLVIPSLQRYGHTVGLLHTDDTPEERTAILPREPGPCWDLAQLGATRAVAALREWKPDLIYCHSIADVEMESAIPDIAPAVFFAHGYHGTCISGSKMHKLPRPHPCERIFGAACLGQFYPRNCGGWNPLTMMRLYGEQSAHLAALRKFQSILVASPHMVREYERHGFTGRVQAIQLPVPMPRIIPAPKRPADRWRLLFLGRLDPLKGGNFLIDALPRVCQELKLPIQVTFAGEGAARTIWEEDAIARVRRLPELEIHFTGWADEQEKTELFQTYHLLVFPSIWPEPFGQVGLEAGHHGMPCAAFDVGGVSSWLKDGVNGHLAPGNPPTPDGLAEAIIRCLRDPATRTQLSQGAQTVARQYTLEAHTTALLEVFAKALQSKR